MPTNPRNHVATFDFEKILVVVITTAGKINPGAMFTFNKLTGEISATSLDEAERALRQVLTMRKIESNAN